MDIKAEIKSIISDYSGLDISEITDDMNLQTEIGLDSFAMISMICDMEERFDIEITDEEVSSMETLSDVVQFVDKKINKVECA